MKMQFCEKFMFTGLLTNLWEITFLVNLGVCQLYQQYISKNHLLLTGVLHLRLVVQCRLLKI